MANDWRIELERCIGLEAKRVCDGWRARAERGPRHGPAATQRSSHRSSVPFHRVVVIGGHFRGGSLDVRCVAFFVPPLSPNPPIEDVPNAYRDAIRGTVLGRERTQTKRTLTKQNKTMDGVGDKHKRNRTRTMSCCFRSFLPIPLACHAHDTTRVRIIPLQPTTAPATTRGFVGEHACIQPCWWRIRTDRSRTK